MRGIQLDPLFSWGGPREVGAVATSPDRLFVDGFVYGYPDLHLTRQAGEWMIELPGAEFPLVAPSP